jgi:hypothetical protein
MDLVHVGRHLLIAAAAFIAIYFFRVPFGRPGNMITVRNVAN